MTQKDPPILKITRPSEDVDDLGADLYSKIRFPSATFLSTHVEVAEYNTPKKKHFEESLESPLPLISVFRPS